MVDFAGKVVLITGAAGGIGRALSEHFANLSAALILLDQHAGVTELAAALAKSGARAAAAQADISDADAVTAAIVRAVAALGPVDVLVNNAAIATAPTLARTTPALWRREIEVDLNGAYHCAAAVLPAMRARGGGAIVTIGSVNGLVALGHPAYSAAKAALISHTQALAVEYGRYNIRANIVCPGTVQTPAWRERVERQPEIFERLKKWYPLGRIVEPSDIAKAVAFLASDDARAITGTVLAVDAGLLAGNAVMAAELTLEEF